MDTGYRSRWRDEDVVIERYYVLVIQYAIVIVFSRPVHVQIRTVGTGRQSWEDFCFVSEGPSIAVLSKCALFGFWVKLVKDWSYWRLMLLSLLGCRRQGKKIRQYHQVQTLGRFGSDNWARYIRHRADLVPAARVMSYRRFQANAVLNQWEI